MSGSNLITKPFTSLLI